MVSSMESLYKTLGVGSNGVINYSSPRLKQIDTNRNGQISPLEAWEYLYAHGQAFKPAIYPVVKDLWTELQSSDLNTRLNAATRLGRMGASGAIPAESLTAVKAALIAIIDKKNLTGTAYCEPYQLRTAALKALVKIGGPEGTAKAVEVLTKRWGPVAINESQTVMREAVRLIEYMALNGRMNRTEAENALKFVRGQHGMKADWPEDVRRVASLALVEIQAKFSGPVETHSYTYGTGFLGLSKVTEQIPMDAASVAHNLRAVDTSYNEIANAYVPRCFYEHKWSNMEVLSDAEVVDIQAALILVKRLPDTGTEIKPNRGAVIAALGELQLDHNIQSGFNGSRFGIETQRHLADEVEKFIRK